MDARKKKLPHPGEVWGPGYDISFKKGSEERLHRSDMLLEKQIIVAKQVIQSLEYAVKKLEKQPDFRKSLLQKIAVLSRKGQHLKLVLEVLNKINLEIKYYRQKLHQSIKGHQEKSELIRQRILWLERRLEKIVLNNSDDQLSSNFQDISLAMSLPEVKAPKSISYGSMQYSKPMSPHKKSVLLAPNGPQKDGKTSSLKEDLEASEKYWLVGHHRFSYTPNMDQLIKDNPLSYHSIGLAVPASYVERNVLPGDRTLPWMDEQDPMKGNFDIMRDDLERIQKRMHRVHMKIYHAANLSVNSLIASNVSPSSKPQSEDAKRARMDLTPQVTLSPAASRSEMYEFKGTQATSIAGGSLAQLSSLSEGNTESHSTQIQSPILYDQRDVLPLTRTNVTKKFPHSCARWSNAHPNKDGLAVQPTIVNQRDLREKTKLKLFIPRRIKQRKSIVRDLITPSSVTSNRSYRKAPTTVRFIENLKSSDGTALSELQKDRLQELRNTLLSSPRAEDRKYAARSLASLGGTDVDETVSTLTSALHDQNSGVRFEVAKALIQLGEWHESAIKELTVHLCDGTKEVCVDVLEQFACSDQANFVHLQIEDKPELRTLIQILRRLVEDSKSESEISFQAAVCLGEICGTYDVTSAEMATGKLLDVIQTTNKWDWHSQALEVLVRQLNHFDDTTLRAIITQLKHARKWQDRLSAALLIAYVGPGETFRLMQEKEAFAIFFPKLWDDARRDVRLGVSQAFTALGLRNRLLEDLDNQINSSNDETRAHAVMSMSAVGIRSDKTLRSLVEMLGLDSSDYVRLQIMRTFHALGITDIRVVRALREREKSGGPLSREASRILASMDVRITTGVSTIPAQHSKQSIRRTATADRTVTGLSWFSSPQGRSRDNLATQESKRMSRPDLTSCSRPSSDIFSPPQYEIISTSVQNSRTSPKNFRLQTGNSHLSSVSSIF